LYYLNTRGTLDREDITLTRGCVWDTIHIDWEGVEVFFQDRAILVSHTVQVPILEKFRIRKMIQNCQGTPQLMAKQGRDWYNIQGNLPIADPQVQTE
jgi:hypothetical protein